MIKHANNKLFRKKSDNSKAGKIECREFKKKLMFFKPDFKTLLNKRLFFLQGRNFKVYKENHFPTYFFLNSGS